MSSFQCKPVRVVITGIGSVTGFGFGWQRLWTEMTRGRHCIREWQPEGITDGSFPVKYAAPVDMALMPEWLQSHPAWHVALEKRARFGWVAASLAVADAGPNLPLREAAVICASGAPHHVLADMQLALAPMMDEPSSWLHFQRRRSEADPDAAMCQSSDRLVGAIANDLGCEGPVINVSSACAGAAQAIGDAFRMIRRGEVNVALAGGADSVLGLDTMTALYLLGAASTETRLGRELCRPFDSERSGLVAGEGGAVLVLESLDSALARGTAPYAEVFGYGSSLDAFRVTAPDPEGRGAARAMQAALDDACMEPERIDLINAHGTSTPLNDTCETLAIKTVFARAQHYRQLAVCANKSQFGHLIAAAGAPEIAAAALSCRQDLVPPTLNLEKPDPQCDLDYCAGRAVRRRVDVALSNSFGFGGLNAALVVGKFRP
jgi:3-oxoacyl-[acyl-carrier-protein] synthase II